MGRIAEKLETLFEQKLQLLPQWVPFFHSHTFLVRLIPNLSPALFIHLQGAAGQNVPPRQPGMWVYEPRCQRQRYICLCVLFLVN